MGYALCRRWFEEHFRQNSERQNAERERRANGNWLTVPRAHSQMKRLRRVAQYVVFVGFWARPKSAAIFVFSRFSDPP